MKPAEHHLLRSEFACTSPRNNRSKLCTGEVLVTSEHEGTLRNDNVIPINLAKNLSIPDWQSSEENSEPPKAEHAGATRALLAIGQSYRAYTSYPSETLISRV